VAGIETATADTPDAPAVVAADGTLTYRELNGRANRLAFELIRRGLGPGCYVAIAVPRGCGLVVSLLGTLKAGAAYVPVDLNHPSQRVAAILTDARPLAVLTTRATCSALPDTGQHVLFIEDYDPEPGPTNPTDEHRVTPLLDTHPAYLLFTSGSTGRPKGVVVEHRALGNVLRAVGGHIDLRAADRLLSVASIGFDIATAEVFLPLLAGATVVVADDCAVRDPDRLAAVIVATRATVMQATPSLWRMLLALRPEALRGLRVLTAGEALTPSLATALVEFAVDVTNLYGPTEATIYATLETVTAGDRPGIGRPIANLSAYVLDERLRQVPPGTPGELHLAGIGLARGYHGRPALTARSFVPDPFGPPGSRMYRTGDRVRQRTDGSYEYLGRLDDQVKIRGVRVEPSEVESALEDHPAVERAVVCAVQRDEGDARLIALVVPVNRDAPAASRPDNAGLRAFLAVRLPEALIPSAFVWSDAVPLGRTGKTDRAAVRALVHGRLGEDTRPAGDDPLEDIWTRCLSADVGEETGFRSAGGHSLSAAQLIGAIEQRYGVRLPFRLLLHDDAALRRVRELLATVAPAPDGGEPHSRPEAPPDGRVALTPALRRLWVLNQLYPLSRTAYHVVVAVELIGEVELPRLDAALAGAVARHDALRMTVVDGGTDRPELAFVPAHEATCRIEVHGRTDTYDPRGFAARCGRLETPTDAPMLSARLQPGPGRCCLVLVFNHLIADLRGAAAVLEDVLVSYAASAGVPPPAASYQEYARRQHAGVGGEQWREDLAYWRATLVDPPGELRLPLAAPRPPAPTFQAHVRTVRLPPELSGSLADVADELRTTWAGLLLGCFAVLLHKWSGQPDIAIGVPTDARRRPAEQRLVAMAMDTLVVRSRVAETIADVVTGCRDAYLAAADHASVPFDVVAEHLGLPASPPRNPVFQAWFNDLGSVPEAGACPGLEVNPVPVPVVGALFDIAVYLRRTRSGHEFDVVGAQDLFDEESVAELADQYLRLLAVASRSPDTALTDTDLRGRDLAPPGSVSPLGRDLWRRLEDFAHADPDAPAVIAAPGTVRYGELREQVVAASSALRERGVSPGRTVVLWARSTALLPVALLAIWRAGATAALLPADAPALFQRACRDSIDADLCVDPGVNLDPGVLSLEDLIGPAEHRREVAACWPSGGAPSHVLFTSGTTGTPAGVVVGADAIEDPIAWYVETFEVSPADRFAMLSGPAHDPILRDVLVPLSAGAAICVPPSGWVGRPDLLCAWLAEYQVTVLHATPALVDLIAGGSQHRLPALRLIVAGGEALTAGHLRRIRTFCDAAVVHAYGTTETPQIAACSLALDRHADPGPAALDDRVLPVGHGVAGRQVYVSHARGRPAAPGQRGEVVVRARNLAAGYLGDTSRSDRFTADPDAWPGFRLYRTGDEGYLTLDDEVVVTGRLDRQVSLYGHRIELAEIEAVARRFEGVTAVRAGLGEGHGGPVLALAVASAPGHQIEIAALRTFLRGRLPRQCVPSVMYTEAEALVLDASRKLRIVDWAYRGGPGEPMAVAPGGEPAARSTARTLHQIVQDILGRPVPERQNLFEAGLSSFTVLQLGQGIVRRLGRALPVTELLAHPSIEALAQFLQDTSGEPSR
jgi:amino acid adenylation domain-containing protein